MHRGRPACEVVPESQRRCFQNRPVRCSAKRCVGGQVFSRVDGWCSAELGLVLALGAMSGAAGSSHTPPRFTLDLGSLVGHMSEHDLLATCLAIASPSTDAEKVFDALIRDPYAVQRVLEELQSVSAMPSDAADRWGAPAALHRCSKRDGNCLAELARAEGGAGLDRLYERLAAAKKAGEASRSLQAAVPARKQAALAHREGGAEGTAASATQAQAAAERLALDALTAHESPLKAATGVRAELRACGCCVEGESAFLSGFQGRKMDTPHATSDEPRVSVARKLPIPWPTSPSVIVFLLSRLLRLYSTVSCPRQCSLFYPLLCMQLWHVSRSWVDAPTR